MKTHLTLTARLLGDPAPDRFARAAALRTYHGLADQDPIADRATRRAKIIALLKGKPMRVRDVADALASDPGQIRNDLERMKAEGVVLRTGSGTGTHSTILWRLAVDEAQAVAAIAAKPVGARFRRLLADAMDHMRPGEGVRPFELAKAVACSQQAMHEALKLGIAEGVLIKTGKGRGASGSVLYHLAPEAGRRAA